MKKLTFLLLLSALAVSAACGGDDDDPTATSPSGDAVTVESDTDEVPPDVMTDGLAMCPLDAFMVEAVTGIEVVESFDAIETGDGTSCTFSSITGETGFGITVYGSTGVSAMETLATMVDDAETVDLRFADDAIWSSGMTTLHAVVGDRGAQVQIADFAGVVTDPLQVATELAEIAIG